MDKSKQASKARERRLRAKYRKNIRIAIILCLIIGLAVGFIVGRMSASTTGSIVAEPDPTVLVTSTPEPTVAPTATVVPSTAPAAAIVTTIPTAEPTAEVTAEPVAEASAEATAEVAAEATAEADVTAEPTAEAAPAAETTSEPASADAEGNAVTVVPFGETQTISVQMYADGTPRTDNQPLPYETLNFQLTVTRLLDNDYYVSNYGSTHRLEDGTAGVEFELMLNDYQGEATIDPNVLIKNVSIESADGLVTYGYRLTNAEISGSDKFTMQTNVPMLLYKRFTQSEAQSLYLVVSVKIDDVDRVYKFELTSSEEAIAKAAAEAAAAYTELTVGDRSDAVKDLQTRLITKGYLELGSDDGIYGNGTAEAIKKAQTDLGMEADGVASPEFQAAIFAEESEN